MNVIEVKNEFNQDESQIRLYSVTEFKRLCKCDSSGQTVPIVFCIVELSNSILQLRSQTSAVSVAFKAEWFPRFDQSDLL